MRKLNDYVLVLWAERFDEAAATIFVTVLREAGLRVKVVGLTPPPVSGAHGLALVPDLSLDQALPLAEKTRGVIFPSNPAGLKRLQSDPRVGDLLQRTTAHRAKFVLGQASPAELAELDETAVDLGQILLYPPGENLLDFAHELANSLCRSV